MKKIWLAISVVAFMGASTAQAEEFRPYAGAGIGAYGMKIAAGGTGNQTAFGGFGLLGVDYGDYLGFELRLGTSSNASFTAGGLSQEIGLDYVFSYLAKAQFPVNESFRIYGLLGGTTGSATATIKTPGWIYTASGTNTIKNSETSLSIGGGIEFQVQDQLSIGAEYMSYFKDVYGYAATIKFAF